MNQASGNDVAPAKHNPLKSLVERISDPQDREWFAQLVSYVNSLPPQDEFVKVAQLFGFLTLLGRELPEALAEERKQLGELLLKDRADFIQQIKTNATYHEQLNARLSKLPGEIAAGVKPADIAQSMAESFRQQIAATGIEETKTYLASATTDLKSITISLDQAVKPLSDRYGNIAVNLEMQASRMAAQCGKLVSAADQVQARNSQLRQEAKSLEWYWLATAALLLLLMGMVLGIHWQQGQTVSGIQAQLDQIYETVKHPPQPAPPPSPVKKMHGGNTR